MAIETHFTNMLQINELVSSNITSHPNDGIFVHGLLIEGLKAVDDFITLMFKYIYDLLIQVHDGVTKMKPWVTPVLSSTIFNVLDTCANQNQSSF